MGLRVANGPVSWGVDLPDKPGAPPWEEVFSEISEAGYRWCELGPAGYLPNDDERGATREDAVDGEVDAVGGRAVDREATRPGGVDAQRPVQRERVTDGTLLAVGRDDDHLRPESGERVGQRL